MKQQHESDIWTYIVFIIGVSFKSKSDTNELWITFFATTATARRTTVEEGKTHTKGQRGQTKYYQW